MVTAATWKNDGVNVDFTVYANQTQITQSGSVIEAGQYAGYRDWQTRKVRWDAVDEPVEYTAGQLDRAAVARDQIRTVIQAVPGQSVHRDLPRPHHGA